MKKYTKIPDKSRIAYALELMVGHGLTPAQTARMMSLHYATVCKWMTFYYFYQKPNEPVVITLKSDV